nr:site-specific DNA-methyltransferase [Faecalibacterium sp. OF04-11AC]
MKCFVSQITAPSDIILDFFSGSATSAHAVMRLNAEDSGHRKFIMVQLPEPCDEKSEAYKAGYKTICDIGKERIRRAGDNIISERNTANTYPPPRRGIPCVQIGHQQRKRCLLFC